MNALRLVRDSDGGDELPPLVAWELFMRGAGRSERWPTRPAGTGRLSCCSLTAGCGGVKQ